MEDDEKPIYFHYYGYPIVEGFSPKDPMGSFASLRMTKRLLALSMTKQPPVNRWFCY